MSSEESTNAPPSNSDFTSTSENNGKGNRKKLVVAITIKAIIIPLKIVIILACTGTLIYQTSQCVMRWLKSDTKAILSVRQTGNYTFLAFTICPSYKEAYNETYLHQIGITREDYKNGNYFGNAQGDNGYDIFEQATYDLYAIMDKIRIGTANVNESNVYVFFNESVEAYNNTAIFETVYDETFGRCFTMQIMERVKSFGIINVEITSKMGIYVYFHHPGQYLHVDSKAKAYGNLGSMMFIDLNYEMTVSTLEEKGKVPCNPALNLDYDICLYREMSEVLMDEFGCVVPFLPRDPGNPVCQFEDSEEGKETQAQVVERCHYLSTHGQRGLCQTPCQIFDVFLGMPFVDNIYNETRAFVKVYIKSTVKKKRIVLDYTWVTMMAEIGGYTGLLLGISLVNITNYFDILLYRVFTLR